MGGTVAGGLKARETMYKLHGRDFYANIGRIGGKNGHTGGFASNPELAKRAGSGLEGKGASVEKLKEIAKVGQSAKMANYTSATKRGAFTNDVKE